MTTMYWLPSLHNDMVGVAVGLMLVRNVWMVVSRSVPDWTYNTSTLVVISISCNHDIIGPDVYDLPCPGKYWGLEHDGLGLYLKIDRIELSATLRPRYVQVRKLRRGVAGPVLESFLSLALSASAQVLA